MYILMTKHCITHFKLEVIRGKQNIAIRSIICFNLTAGDDYCRGKKLTVLEVENISDGRHALWEAAATAKPCIDRYCAVQWEHFIRFIL